MKTKIFIKFILFIAPKLVIIYLSTLTLTLIHATLNSLLHSLIHDIIQQPLQLYYIGLTVTVTLTRHYSAATSTLLHWTPCYLHSYTILFSSHFNFATLNSLLPSLIHNIIQQPLQLCYIELTVTSFIHDIIQQRLQLCYIELIVTLTHTQHYSAATSTLLHWTHCYPHSYTTLFSNHFNFNYGSFHCGNQFEQPFQGKWRIVWIYEKGC
jgi:hypothetical protein